MGEHLGISKEIVKANKRNGEVWTWVKEEAQWEEVKDGAVN